MQPFKQRFNYSERSNSTNDPFSLDSESTLPSSQVGTWSKQMKIIRFTGDMKENIDELLRGIECRCGVKKDYSQIINVYGQKIVRLREERGRCKQAYNQQKLKNETLQSAITQMQNKYRALEESYYFLKKDSVPREDLERHLKEKQMLIQKLAQTEMKVIMLQKNVQEPRRDSSNKFKGEPMKYCKNILQSGLEQSLESDLLEISAEDDSQMRLSLQLSTEHELLEKENDLLKQKLKKYDDLFKDTKLEPDEAISILKEYIEDAPTLCTKQERELYFLAKKMKENVWKKRLEVEIKELMQRRENVRKLELEFSNKKKSAGRE